MNLLFGTKCPFKLLTIIFKSLHGFILSNCFYSQDKPHNQSALRPNPFPYLQLLHLPQLIPSLTCPDFLVDLLPFYDEEMNTDNLIGIYNWFQQGATI